MNADNSSQSWQMVRRLRVFAFICGSFLLAGLSLVGAEAACELPPRQDPGKSWTVYRLDPGASVVRFNAKAFMHDFQGKTSRVHGTIRLGDLDRLTDAEACVRIDAASLETGNSTRDGTMRDTHLETGKFPTIDFLLTRVEAPKRQSGDWEFTARGTLSLHGVSREIILPLQARQTGDLLRLTAEVPVKMTDYRIRIPTFLFFAVEDQVLVTFDVTARRAE
jgi:polyisoprenoid-binding protein YceI